MMSDIQAQLQQAAQFAREGNRSEARRILIEVVKANPRHEGALMGLVAVSSGEERVKILQRVLQINPNHAKAREILAKLRPTSEQPAPESQPLPPKTSPFVMDEAAAPPSVPTPPTFSDGKRTTSEFLADLDTATWKTGTGSFSAVNTSDASRGALGKRGTASGGQSRLGKLNAKLATGSLPRVEATDFPAPMDFPLSTPPSSAAPAQPQRPYEVAARLDDPSGLPPVPIHKKPAVNSAEDFPFDDDPFSQPLVTPPTFGTSPMGASAYPAPPPFVPVVGMPKRKKRTLTRNILIISGLVIGGLCLFVMVGSIILGLFVNEDAITVEPVAASDLGDEGLEVAYSPDGSLLAVAFDHQVNIYDTATNRLLSQLAYDSTVEEGDFQAEPLEIQWLWDSDFLVIFWSSMQYQVVYLPENRVTVSYDTNVPIRIFFSEPNVFDYFYIAYVRSDNFVMRHQGVYRDFTEDSFQLPFEGEHAFESQFTQILIRREGQMMAVQSNNKVIAVAGQTHLEIYRYSGGNARLHSIETPKTSYAVTWSPDDRYLAVGMRDGTVKVYDFENDMKVVHTLTTNAQKSPVRDVEWTSDDQWILGKYDEQVRVWDAATGDLKHVLSAPEPIVRIDLHPDDTRVVGITLDGQLIYWDIPE